MSPNLTVNKFKKNKDEKETKIKAFVTHLYTIKIMLGSLYGMQKCMTCPIECQVSKQKWRERWLIRYYRRLSSKPKLKSMVKHGKKIIEFK